MRLFTLSLLTLSLISGCATFEDDKVVTAKVDDIEKDIKAIQNSPKYAILDEAYQPAVAVSTVVTPKSILSEKRIALKGQGLPFAEILKEFEAVGVQIITPLESIVTNVYNGYEIHETDVLTALDMITTSMGFDYEVDADLSGRPVVTITGLQTEEYTLNLPPFKSGFYMSAGGQSGAQGGGQGGQGGQQQASQGGNNGSQGGSQGGGQSGDNTSQSLTSMGQKVSYIESENDFWKNLKIEMEAMSTEMRPVSFDDSVARQITNTLEGDYRPVKVASVTINESSGRIFISAPKHIRKRIVSYLKRLDQQLNTRLVIEGRLLSVTSQNNEQRGIDWAKFDTVGNDYNVVVGNPILGGSEASLIPESLDNVPLFGNGATNPFIGIIDVENTFKAFNAYLSRDNSVRLVDEVSETTTSGITANSIELDDNISTIYSQSATVTSDAGTSGGGVTPELINVTTGSIFQVTPIFDPSNGVIRSYVNINLKLANGTETVTSIITSATGTESIDSDYTETKQITMQSNAISRSGETIIISGKTRSYEATTTEGVTKLKDTYLGGLAGTGERNLIHNKYYFLMNIRAIPYNVGN